MSFFRDFLELDEDSAVINQNVVIETPVNHAQFQYSEVEPQTYVANFMNKKFDGIKNIQIIIFQRKKILK